MTGAYARGACPGLSAPMETGDGLLVRLLPVAPIPLDSFSGLCTAARAHGNGILEISTRGSVQMRGLTPLSAPLLAAEVARLDIAISEGVPVIADPLPDDPAALVDAGSIAATLRRAVAGQSLRLAPKVSVVIDGGGSLDLDALFADIRVRAVPTETGPKFQLAIAGDAMSATPVGMVGPDEAVGAVLALLARIAAQGPEARAADLPPLPSATESGVKAARAPRAETVGRHPLKDGAVALGLGLAFGHSHADDLMQLALIAKTHGARWARPAPGRSLLLGLLDGGSAAITQRAAEALGFVAEPSDPRRRIAACPGAPLCAHGLIAARALAAKIARQVPLPGKHGIALHVSGCAKGCAHPRPAALTVVGIERGCGMVRDGTARDAPSAYIDPAVWSPSSAASPGRRGSWSMLKRPDYLRDGNAIYQRSFAIIREEADLSRFSPEEADLVVRMIHACGQVDAAQSIAFGRGLVGAARGALQRGAPILCDAEMVAHGITRARLPANNEVICTLRDPSVPELAAKLGTTRSAAALDLWGNRLDGALVAIGNAPTALFRLLEKLEAGAPPPAAILGVPVGFVGAAESKEALAANSYGVPYLIVRGRMGGSAMTAAAVNALARQGL